MVKIPQFHSTQSKNMRECSHRKGSRANLFLSGLTTSSFVDTASRPSFPSYPARTQGTPFARTSYGPQNPLSLRAVSFLAPATHRTRKRRCLAGCQAVGYTAFLHSEERMRQRGSAGRATHS